MKIRTHVAIGCALSLHLPIIYVPLFLVGNIFPDADWRLGMDHRGISHCLTLWGGLCLLSFLFSGGLAGFFFLGCLTHSAADFLTPMGVPLLPFGERVSLQKRYTGKKKLI